MKSGFLDLFLEVVRWFGLSWEWMFGGLKVCLGNIVFGFIFIFLDILKL